MSAVISECGTYRYTLTRKITTGVPVRSVCFVGVNPSTADAIVDDATVRKWRGFAERWHLTRFTVVNLFAYRARDVIDLAYATQPVGPENDEYLQAAFEDSEWIVPCWGSREKLPASLHYRIDDVRALLRRADRKIRVFGLTNSRDPKHPLMLSYLTQLQEWTP